jgi:hypothetical protein
MPRSDQRCQRWRVARSARTRRPVTCGRLEVGRSQNGIVGMGNLLRYRVESVKHDTSPSCRDLRTARSCVFKRQPRRIRVADACPCTPRPLGLVTMRVGIASRRLSFALGASGMHEIPPGDVQTKSYPSHIAMGSVRRSHVEAPPTCTPPPICTLAPFPIPRWSQDRGRR